MTPFSDLSQALASAGPPDGSLGLSQKDLDKRFPSVVATGPLRIWSPGDPVTVMGKRLLIGVATWSAHAMKLLDAVSEALQGLPARLTVEVFNVAECSAPAGFDRYVPGIGNVFHTPVVGLWSEGQLVQKATGSEVGWIGGTLRTSFSLFPNLAPRIDGLAHESWRRQTGRMGQLGFLGGGPGARNRIGYPGNW